jgi:membrane-associated phospholipid phosphatase
VDVPLAKLLRIRRTVTTVLSAVLMRLRWVDGRAPASVWPALLLLFGVARWRRWPTTLSGWVALLALIANQGLIMQQVCFNRPRPLTVLGELVWIRALANGRDQVDGFPSGHAAGCGGPAAALGAAVSKRGPG